MNVKKDGKTRSGNGRNWGEVQGRTPDSHVRRGRSEIKKYKIHTTEGEETGISEIHCWKERGQWGKLEKESGTIPYRRYMRASP